MPELREIEISDIIIDHDFNSREEAVTSLAVIELARDIKKRGLIQPVVVCERPDGKYDLIAGFRRTKACTLNQMTSIPCVVRKNMSELERIALNFAENKERANLNFIEEAKVIKRLHDLHYTKNDITTQLGKSWTWCQLRLETLHLPEEIQEDVRNGVITQTDIKRLINVFNATGETEVMRQFRRLKDAHAQGKERIKVQTIEKRLSSKAMRSKQEIFQMQDLIRETFGGNNPMTAVLGWAGGALSRQELYDYLAERAEAVGKEFKPIEYDEEAY